MLNGSQGAGFNANGTNGAQLETAYNQTQAGIKQQQDFVNQLNAQNGIGNQANVFGQQQGLANQLQGVANGTGPNPAQAMLAQATGANTANQAALMAGQRGASQNVGLMARQAAQQGAANQQNAAGQAATMQANQSLGALGQLGAQQANMANVAQNQIGNQQTGLSNLNQASQGQQANLLGIQGNQNTANANIAQGNQKTQAGLFGGVMNSIGSMFADGGAVKPMYAEGTPNGTVQVAQQPMSNIGKFAKGLGQGVGGTAPGQPQDPVFEGASSLTSGLGRAVKSAFNSPSNTDTTVSPTNLDSGRMQAAHGGKVPALVSPGEKYLTPDKVNKVAQGANPMREGETIPGKPKVKGAVNSYANDTVPKTLEEGGIVIPRHITQGKNPEKAAHEFISAILAKNGKSMPKKSK